MGWITYITEMEIEPVLLVWLLPVAAGAALTPITLAAFFVAGRLSSEGHVASAAAASVARVRADTSEARILALEERVQQLAIVQVRTQGEVLACKKMLMPEHGPSLDKQVVEAREVADSAAKSFSSHARAIMSMVRGIEKLLLRSR